MGIDIKYFECFKELYESPADKYRFFIYYGGRYGGKNGNIAPKLCLEACLKKQQFLILRKHGKTTIGTAYDDIKSFFVGNEIETTIKDLTLGTLKSNNQIITYKAQHIILNTNGSEFIFAGINDNVIDSLKGFNRVNWVWVDEANFLSELCFNKLNNTIRAENSKLIFSFNPEKSDDFLYNYALKTKDKRAFVKKITAAKFDESTREWVCGDNPFLNKTILDNINADFKSMTAQMFAFHHLGEPYDVEDGNVINTGVIGYFNDNEPQRYERIIITADTAFSKNENADFSVIGVFCVKGKDIHLTRLFRGRWDFNELQTQAINAYEWAVDTYHLSPTDFIIEKKASGISLLQELKRLTHLPLREVTPKKDKFTRVSSILSEFQRLKLPMSKNPLNSWVSGYLGELKAFRADEQHLHDDQVDMTYYALDFLTKRSVSWSDFL